jgi:hypothetical protein
MTLDQTLARLTRFQKISGLAESTISRKVFKDGKRWKRLRDVRSCTIGLLERANDRLDELEKTYREEKATAQ